MTQLDCPACATLPVVLFRPRVVPMKFENLTDESLLAYYESVRRQVAANSQLGGRDRLIGANVKQFADELTAEMKRRQLRFRPIDWS
jgi:hypothetical protein